MRLLIAAYIVAGILAFGYSAATPTDDCARSYPARHQESICEIFGGLIAAAFWPFYLSWAAFDSMEKLARKETLQ